MKQANVWKHNCGVNSLPLGKKILFYTKRDWQLYALLLLPMSYFIIFKYFPMYGIVIAFQNFNLFKGIFGSEWIGFDVFREIFAMETFYVVVRNTLMLNLLDLVVSFPAPIFLALVINEIKSKVFKKTAQTILYLPYFISWVIISGMIYQILASKGVVNTGIKSLGFGAVPFLTDKWYWLATYALSGVWQSAGWGTIIYLAAITGIPSELYEAAKMDGAGRIRRIFCITLPSIKSTIVVLLIMRLGALMSIGFERPYMMGNALVYDFSEVISTFVYSVGLQSGRFNVGTAVGLFQALIGFVLISVGNYAAKKLGEDGIW